MPQTPWDVAPIAEQRRLSQRVVALVSAAIGRCYRLDVVGHDIGSFARGTHADDTVDIDVLCLGIPHDSACGSHEWTADDTYGAQAARELTAVDQVRAVDPPLGEAITAIVHQLGMTGIAESPRFQWLRTAQGSPDVFFRVEATRPAASTIGVDVTLAHGRENFGLEHAQRFERYLQRVAEADGAQSEHWRSWRTSATSNA